METTGSQNGSKQNNSPISNEDLGSLISSLHMSADTLNIAPEDVDRLSSALTFLAHRPSEDVVEGWEPDPPLLSDNKARLGASDSLVEVTLPILGIDWFWAEFLPRLEEWVTALYRGKALEALQRAASDPIGFIIGMIEQIIRRPKNDKIKVSFYQFFAETFGAECKLVKDDSPFTLRSQWVAVLPGNQIQDAVKRLVETNRLNFTELLDGMPTQLRYLITSIRTASMLSIEKLNEQLLQSIFAMTAEASAALHSSGGADDTGTAGSGVSPEERPLLTSLSEH